MSRVVASVVASFVASLAVSLVSLLVLGLSPTNAAAQCLEGTAVLGDQRDLAEVADAIESACPCASAASRSGHRSCAKGVVEAALAGGDLRSDCKKIATKAYKDATCGSDLIACGRYKATSAKKPLGCKITSSAGCRDTAKVESTVCAEETHCSDVVSATAATCFDPNEPGPYSYSQRQFVWTKPSQVDPEQDRVLNTWVTYPAASAPGTPKPVDPAGAPYPVVLFSHGSCGFPNQSTFLTNHLATHGYIVVAPPHPGNTLSDGAACGSFQAQVASVQERPRDMIFVLDQILAENADPESDFFGMVDPTRIVMSGHSFGGLTTYLTQALEPRIIAAMPFAPAASPTSELTVPSLTMVGEVDSVVNNAATLDAYERSSAPKTFVEIGSAGHYAWSNNCFAGNDCNPPVTLTQAEAHAAVLQWVIPFVERYARGVEGLEPFFLPVPYPGLVVLHEE
ncbi:MAG: hypothetical protein FJ144_11005 [Deltaproteobacteria bacterium]|nr:hypothetical protein [Deltaproteobacteria bacterium]